VKKEEGKWEREEFAGKNFFAKKILPAPPFKKLPTILRSSWL
jgi:hypothetical protein